MHSINFKAPAIISLLVHSSEKIKIKKIYISTRSNLRPGFTPYKEDKYTIFSQTVVSRIEIKIPAEMSPRNKIEI